MTTTLFHNPGQFTTLVLETHNSDGYRTDGYPLPIIGRVILPSLELMDGYPEAYPCPMTQLDTGLFYHKFRLPTGAAALGTYIADVVFEDPATGNITTIAYQIVVSAVAGNYGFTNTA